MAQREDERDSGLGVVFHNLDTQVLAVGRRPRKVRRLRRRRAGRQTGMVAAVLLTAALIASPAIVYAGMLPDAPREGPPGVVPAGVEAPEPTPTPTPTPTPPKSGPIAVDELRDFALPQVPAGWTCPTSGITATDADAVAAGAVLATAISHGDVDGDGAADAVVVLRCVLKESAGPEAAVAFTRLGADVVPIGVVTATTGTTVQWLTAIRVAEGGAVTVTAGDLQPYADQPVEWTRYQDADFWYIGNGQFTGSLPSFTPLANPSSRARADLWVRSGNLTYDAHGEGTISLTVGNRGGVLADDVWLTLDPGGPLSAQVQGWDACLEIRSAPPWAVPTTAGRSVPLSTPVPETTPGTTTGTASAGEFAVQCRLGDLETGDELSLLLVVRRDGESAPQGTAVAYRRALGGAPVPDLTPGDDQAIFAVR
ncbi:hypothetical protein J2S43_003131 [Catenuloplanes nepalensis]|uniref:Uncharacterized protein n=1 Tax=Catenuloplanes nepalensis TaxID=587533 RepID=A0ABT9MT46_9ACTN|nr:hypothetical protein [Catenuloplanes nepalensis]MDP9794619.1 hypothetical protein [Catenuloplanes nepalensis]